MTNALAKLDKATQMLAEAKNLDEVKNIMDIAEAARTYARAAKLGLEAYNHAAEVKARAERKAGEFLKQLDHGQQGGDRKSNYQADNLIFCHGPFVQEIIRASWTTRWRQEIKLSA